jgi:hypothetical protein
MQNTLSSTDQLKLFHDYKQKLTALVGQKEMTRVISQSVFFTLMGPNDIINNYFLLPLRRHQYDLPSYVDFLVSSAINFTKVITANSNLSGHFSIFCIIFLFANVLSHRKFSIII